MATWRDAKETNIYLYVHGGKKETHKETNCFKPVQALTFSLNIICFQLIISLFVSFIIFLFGLFVVVLALSIKKKQKRNGNIANKTKEKQFPRSVRDLLRILFSVEISFRFKKGNLAGEK